MKRKKFVKQLQSIGIQRNAAAWYVRAIQKNRMEYAAELPKIRSITYLQFGATNIVDCRRGAILVKMGRIPL